MTAGARIVVTEFPLGSSRLVPWRRHSIDVLGGLRAAPPEPSGSPAVWHLAASNHRMLARSVAVFSSAREAVRSAGRVLTSTAQLEAIHVRSESGLGWFLRLDDEPLVACARWYSTERDRRKSVDAASAALRGATFGEPRGRRTPEYS